MFGATPMSNVSASFSRAASPMNTRANWPRASKPLPTIARVELDDTDRRIEAGQVEAGVAAPAADANGQPARRA